MWAMQVLYFRLSNIDVSLSVVCRGLIVVGSFFFFTKTHSRFKNYYRFTVYIAICEYRSFAEYEVLFKARFSFKP
jgi:hypothetical protein